MTVEEMIKMDEIRAEFRQILRDEQFVIENWIREMFEKTAGSFDEQTLSENLFEVLYDHMNEVQKEIEA